MMEQTQMRRRILLAAAAALAAVVLAGGVVVAQLGPNYEASKTGPPFADQDEVITYTIEVVNTGSPATGVSLWDEVPDFTTLESCTVRHDGSEQSCSPPNLWTLDFDSGERAVTKLAVRVGAGTLNFSVTNQAVLTWTNFARVLGPVTTVVNPYRVYLPLTVRNVAR